MTQRDLDPEGDLALPEVITRYQEAHDRRDTPVALSSFGSNARVVDDGHEYCGTADISGWLDHAASEYTFTRSLLKTESIDINTWIVINRLEGNFPGGVVDLRYRFVLTSDLISELAIAP